MQGGLPNATFCLVFVVVSLLVAVYGKVAVFSGLDEFFLGTISGAFRPILRPLGTKAGACWLPYRVGIFWEFSLLLCPSGVEAFN